MYYIWYTYRACMQVQKLLEHISSIIIILSSQRIFIDELATIVTVRNF